MTHNIQPQPIRWASPRLTRIPFALYTDTHTLAEGAGAAAFAALMRECDMMRGKRVAVIVSGQNIDRPWMQTVMGPAKLALESMFQ